VATAAALGLAAGLSTVGAACQPSPSELAVRFRVAPGTTLPDPSLVAAARAACPGSARVVLQAASASTLVSVLRVPLRYTTTGAGDAEVARVEACLHRQPGVESVSPQGNEDA